MVGWGGWQRIADAIIEGFYNHINIKSIKICIQRKKLIIQEI
jgi:hypothetical protein